MNRSEAPNQSRISIVAVSAKTLLRRSSHSQIVPRKHDGASQANCRSALCNRGQGPFRGRQYPDRVMALTKPDRCIASAIVSSRKCLGNHSGVSRCRSQDSVSEVAKGRDGGAEVSSCRTS